VFVVAIFSLIGIFNAEFSIILPQNWIQKSGIQHAYANSDVEGYMIVHEKRCAKGGLS
jgi:hypothetical protein